MTRLDAEDTREALNLALDTLDDCEDDYALALTIIDKKTTIYPSIREAAKVIITDIWRDEA